MADAFEQTLTALADAYTTAAELIAGLPAGQAAFELASQLRDLLSDLATAAALLRADQAHRIFVNEELTLEVLAHRIGVSTARAHQILKNARKGQTP